MRDFKNPVLILFVMSSFILQAQQLNAQSRTASSHHEVPLKAHGTGTASNAELERVLDRAGAPPAWDPQCPSFFEYEDVCPAAGSISLSLGDNIDIGSTWLVGGMEAGPLEGCLIDDCSSPEDLTIIVTDIDVLDSDCEYTVSVTFQAIDACSNLSVPRTFTYSFVDRTPPVPPAAPEDITIECIKEIPYDSDLSAFDACQGIISVFGTDTDQGGFGCPDDPFIITRTWTFDDGCGNTSSVSHTITVADEIPPTWSCICESDTTYAGCPGEIDISLEVGDVIDIFTGWTVGGVEVPGLVGCVADNCTEPVDIAIHVDAITFSGDGCSDTVTVSFIAEDECGNLSETFTCFYVFADTEAPEPPAVSDITVACILDVTPAEEDTLTAYDACGGPIIATATDSDNGGSGCGEDTLVITRTWEFTDECGNTTSISSVLTVETPPGSTSGESTVEASEDCDECDGGLNYLELRNNGPGADIKVFDKHDNDLYFSGSVSSGNTFGFSGTGNNDRLGPKVNIYVDGVLAASPSTNCGGNNGPGAVFGPFEVVSGNSVNGGPLCSVESGPCECAGGLTMLEVVYNGSISGSLRVHDGGSVYYAGPLVPGQVISMSTLAGENRMRNNLDFVIDDAFHADVHTSCSEPIYVGMTFGDFEITAGISRNNGALCEPPPPDPCTCPEDDDEPETETDPECQPCDGGTVLLELEYTGAVEGLLLIKDGNSIYFHEMVYPGDVIALTPLPGDFRLKNNLRLIMNGSSHAEIHTSCSEPLGPGMTFGDFLVTRAVSRNGGDMCPEENSQEQEEEEEEGSSCDCAGGTVRLEVAYLGTVSGSLVVKDGSSVYYDGPVSPGSSVSLSTLPGEHRMRNNLDFLIEGSLAGEVHTSCSVPIYIGMTFGDFEIVYGESRNNGPFCNGENGRHAQASLPDAIYATTYPNPFRSSVSIAFSLPSDGLTIFEVTDLSGKRMYMEELGVLPRSRSHNIEYSPEDHLQGGTYIYRIISGSHVVTGRIVLMR